MIELRTLGTLDLRAERDGGKLRALIARPKRLALLVYLALARPRGLHRRDALFGIFWPEATLARARAALNQSLYILRRELGADAIVTHGDEDVGVNRDLLSCDAIAFDSAIAEGRLFDALELYAGDLLFGFHLSGAPDFERWLDTERDRLERSAIDAAKALAKREEAGGNLAGAAQWLRRAAGMAPYDQFALRALMTALSNLGDSAGAIRAFEEFRDRLTRDLELQPETETVALVSNLRAANGVRAEWTDDGIAATRASDLAAGEVILHVNTTPATHAATPNDSAQSPYVTVGHTRTFGIAFVGLLIVMLVALAAWPRQWFANTRDFLPNRVIVIPFDSPSNDSAGAVVGRMAAHWVTQGLQRSGLVEVIDPITTLHLAADVDSVERDDPRSLRIREIALGAQAGTIVSGAVVKQGSRWTLHARVADGRDGRVLRALDPVTASLDSIGVALDYVRTHVAGALASVLDERLASIVDRSSAPPSFKAYQEFVRGLDRFTFPYREAYEHFARASRLDSTFTTATFWALTAAFNAARFAEQDSIIRELLLRRERLTPVDQAGLEVFLAQGKGDWERALDAAKRAAKSAPQSSWTYIAAWNAFVLARPHDALRELDRLDLTRGWARSSMLPWSLRMWALHQIGDFEGQLTLAARARAFALGYPARLQREVHELIALAALGRISKLDQRIAAIMPHAAAFDTSAAQNIYRTVAVELRAHGSQQLAHKYLSACLTLRDHIQCLYEMGRYSDVVERFATDTAQFETVSAAAAQLGRYDEASRLLDVHRARYSRSANGRRFAEARIAALSGNPRKALELLHSDSQVGRIWLNLHWSADFDSIRGDPTLKRLLTSRE